MDQIADFNSDEFLNKILELQRNQRIDNALDLLFETIDTLCSYNRWYIIDNILRKVTYWINHLSIYIKIGILSITLPVKSKLYNRTSLFKHVAFDLIDTEGLELTYKTLQGLE